jgi:catechol-2,3-dioxygenase
MRKETKEGFMKNWFLDQHFTKKELEKIWNWSEISNTAVAVEKEGNWWGYMTEDKNQEVELVVMETKEACENWIKRLGFELFSDLKGTALFPADDSKLD